MQGRTIMANIKTSVAENVPGDFFVDAACIDCDTRHSAPRVPPPRGGPPPAPRGAPPPFSRPPRPGGPPPPLSANPFGARRVTHRLELSSQPDAEVVLDGDEPIELAPEFLAI